MENVSHDALNEQIEFLLQECRNGLIDIHQLMKLIDMAYSDFLDFHPQEKENFNDRQSEQSKK